MKITILQDFLRSGGTERQSVHLANALTRHGHETTLLTFRPGGQLADTVSPQVHHFALQPFDLKLDWFAPRLTSAVRGRAPDVVLSMGRMANCYAGTLHRSLPTAAVINTMRTGKPLPLLFRESLRTTAHIVANSHDARQTLIRQYGVSPQKTSVIYNSLLVDMSCERRRNESLREEMGAKPDTRVLLCVAMFRPEKNQRELIEIAAAFPPGADFQLWFAGDGPERIRCEQFVRQRSLNDVVKFLGFHRDPAPFYAAADIAVHASSSEALSNFLIEAQAHGLPAVAYQAQGIEECFIPGITGWAIARDDRPAFRARLMALDTLSFAEREVIAAKAQAFVRENFDAARNVSRYLDLFDALRKHPPVSITS